MAATLGHWTLLRWQSQKLQNRGDERTTSICTYKYMQEVEIREDFADICMRC